MLSSLLPAACNLTALGGAEGGRGELLPAAHHVISILLVHVCKNSGHLWLSPLVPQALCQILTFITADDSSIITALGGTAILGYEEGDLKSQRG